MDKPFAWGQHWLILLNMVAFGSNHFSSDSIISFLFMAQWVLTVWTYHTYTIHLLVNSKDTTWLLWVTIDILGRHGPVHSCHGPPPPVWPHGRHKQISTSPFHPLSPLKTQGSFVSETLWFRATLSSPWQQPFPALWKVTLPSWTDWPQNCGSSPIPPHQGT